MGPFYILGAPRSGTTAMARALHTLGRFGTWSTEGHALYFFRPALARIVNGKVNPNSLFTREGAPERFLEGFAGLMNTLFNETGDLADTRYLEKTPDHHQVECLHFVRRLYPQARYIFLYRPPLAVARSTLANFGAPVVPTAERWVKTQEAWRRQRRQLPAGSWAEIYQPDMIDDPAAVAEALRPVLGLADEEVERLASFWRKNTQVNRPRGPKAVAYDAVSLSDDERAEVLKVTEAEVQFWPRLGDAHERL